MAREASPSREGGGNDGGGRVTRGRSKSLSPVKRKRDGHGDGDVEETAHETGKGPLKKARPLAGIKGGADKKKHKPSTFVFKKTKETKNEPADKKVPSPSSAKVNGVQAPSVELSFPKRAPPTAAEHSSFVSPQAKRMTVHDSVVPLPISDTPMIRRNRDMRERAEERRKSSTSRRTRRTSSIGNGFIALPHGNISHEEYYRHISADLPDPVRMRQLLSWCAKRASEIDQKSASSSKKLDGSLVEMVKTIQVDVLRRLVENKIITSWYHRPAATPGRVRESKKVPHPQNVANLEKIRQLELHLQRLKQEDDLWSDLIASVNSAYKDSLNVADDEPEEAEHELAELDSEAVQLLSRAQDLCSEGHAVAFNDWVSTSATQLEYWLDSLRHSLHTAGQLDGLSARYSTHRLGNLADLLNGAGHSIPGTKSDLGKSRKPSPDPMDLLRALSRP